MEISSNELIGTDGNLKKKLVGPFRRCRGNITANVFLLQYIVELLPVIFLFFFFFLGWGGGVSIRYIL